MPPHFKQVHRTFSFLRNFLIPNVLIFARFSIILILYLVRYLLSNVLNLTQGSFSHSWQNVILCFFNSSQFLILQLRQLNDLLSLLPLQPGQFFFSLRYAIQIPQFIPQGAMSELLMDIAVFIVWVLSGNVSKMFLNWSELLLLLSVCISCTHTQMTKRWRTPPVLSRSRPILLVGGRIP